MSDPQSDGCWFKSLHGPVIFLMAEKCSPPVSSRKELISTKVQEVLSVQFRKYFLYYGVYNRLDKHLSSASTSCSDSWIYIDLIHKWQSYFKVISRV